MLSALIRYADHIAGSLYLKNEKQKPSNFGGFDPGL